MAEQILKMKKITKYFGGIRALYDVDLDLYRGEVLCLLGENGAGKSTLIKILSGVEQPSSGEIFLNGDKVHLKNPKVAHEMGFSTVYQELVQFPEMSIAENIYIGRYPQKTGLIDFNELKKKTNLLLIAQTLDILCCFTGP